MLLIRRLVDRRRAYTALLLPGEPPRIFPTTDYEHSRILEIYLQDRPRPGIENDFTTFAGLRGGPDARPPSLASDPGEAPCGRGR